MKSIVLLFALDLLGRMAALNPGLHTFTASMHANVALRSFPFLSMQLEGTYYRKEPDQSKVVFNSGLPSMAEQFDKLFAHIVSPSRWRDSYTVTTTGDDGTTTTFKLVPRKTGNVQRIDARVSDADATVQSMRWTYNNGGFAEMHNNYGKIEGDVLVTSQTGHIEEPGYKADVTSTFDNYKINPPLDDSVFAQ